MTDFLSYRQNKIEKDLQTHQTKHKEIEQQEKQLELYENNTGKTNIEAHLELAKQYHNNKINNNTARTPLTAENLAGDFDLL